MLAPHDSSAANLAIPRLQPMRLTDILDGTFSLYRNYFRFFFQLALVYFATKLCLGLLSRFVFSNLVPSLDIADLILKIPLEGMLGTYATVFLVFVSALFTGFVDNVVLLLIVGGLGFAGASCYLGRTITPSDVFRQCLRRFWPFFGYIMIWYPLDTFGWWWVIRIPIMIYLNLGWGLGKTDFLWMIFIGTPLAIYLSIRWGFGALPILFEGASLATALRRSSELVRGTWWRVCGIYAAIFLLWWTLSIILQTTADVLLQLIGVTTGDNIIERIMRMRQLRENPDSFSFFAGLPQQSFFSFLIEWLTYLGIATLMLPVRAIGSMLLYFDLRIRKEGFDIEIMVNSRESID